MHFSVFVMIGPDTDIESGVLAALAPFDESLEVPPYREHLDHAAILSMAKYYGIDPANLHALSRKMKDWRGCEGGVDRKGLYSLLTCNPNGRWDWYEIGGRWNRYIKGSKRNVIRAMTLANSPRLKGCLPYFVLTPDGEWIEHERMYFPGDLSTFKREQMADGDWMALVREQLLRWPTHQVVSVDIHS